MIAIIIVIIIITTMATRKSMGVVTEIIVIIIVPFLAPHNVHFASFTKKGNNTEGEQAFILQRAFDGTSPTTTATRRKRRCISYY